MKKFLEPIQRYFNDFKSDPVEHVKKSPVFWVLSVLFLAWLIIEVPRLQVNGTTLSDPEKRFNAENEARKTILQGLGGGFFFISAYFTWRSLQVSEKTRQAAEDKQVTERFVKAAEMLADEKDRLEVRTAGIYALERIAKDSKDDHWTVMEVLTLLIRNKTASRHADPEQGARPNFPEDIQTALRVISNRDAEKDGDNRLDLSGANLAGADLLEVKLAGADLKGANLKGADLKGANLKGANLAGANLTFANLTGADLAGADLTFTHCRAAGLKWANLKWANLKWANLDWTDLEGADLEEANLEYVDLKGAYLRGANLRGTYLIDAKNLTPEQVREAKNWENAIYGSVFVEQLGLDKDKQITRAIKWDEKHKP